MFILFRCSFGFSILYFHLAGIRNVKSSLNFDLILRLLGSLGFLCFGGLPWLSVSISSNLFSVSISEICSLCLLVSFFQGDLFGGISCGLSVLSIYFFLRKIVRFCSNGRDAWSLLLFGLSYCLVYFLGGLQFRCYVGVGFSLELVQHGA